MNSEERIKQQKALVEEMGRFFDKEGLQPIASRILALLIIMDKELFTFEEIVEELQISKSSASNTLKNLEIRGDIEYITLPGDRKRYFKLKIQDSFVLIDEFTKKIKDYRKLLSKTIELKADKESKNAKFIDSIASMIDFFTQDLDEKKEAYKNKK